MAAAYKWYTHSCKIYCFNSTHRQDSTYHGLCYTSRGALAGTRNSSMGPPHVGSIRRPIAPWANALTTELHLAERERERERETHTHTVRHDFICVYKYNCFNVFDIIAVVKWWNDGTNCHSQGFCWSNVLPYKTLTSPCKTGWLSLYSDVYIF